MKDDAITKVYKRTLIFSFIIMGFSFFVFKNPKPIVLGFLFGLIISILSFKLLESTINRSVKMTPGRASAYSTVHYMFRYLIYFIVLSVAVLADYLNFPATVLGILMIKITIIVSTALDKEFTK
nr:ATP synthase subunit I [Tissierella sp.]